MHGATAFALHNHKLQPLKRSPVSSPAAYNSTRSFYISILSMRLTAVGSAHLFSLSHSLREHRARATGRKSRAFSERLSPFSCPYHYGRDRATLLFSTANNTPPRPRLAPPLRRPSAFGAFNLRAHHRAGQEQVQAGIETGSEGGRGTEAEGKKKRESERGGGAG